MLSLRRDLEELLKKYPDPRKREMGLIEFSERELVALALPRYGTVSDNKDPQCLGRVRVACDMIAPGAVTPWIPIVSLGATKKTGWWQLPDIGTQVLLAFPWRNVNKPVVLGCIYDQDHRPPEPTTRKAGDRVLYQTKKHRLEIIDEEGQETFTISSARGQMRMTFDAQGIKLINELGDIQIKCRKLRIEGEEGVNLIADKKLSINSEECISMKTTKGIKVANDKEVTLKGQSIKLNATRGITTEGKQLAAEGDKVMGFDIHQMVVPSGSGTAVVPLPHPYIGKIKEKVSENVKINGHNAATKGSVSKHDHPVHNQLPGTLRFNKNPTKEGEVTNGTGKKVKINGKEAAVVGSQVTTCNDTGVRNNSTILAAGASMPMPVIINPKNMPEYNEERARQETKRPEITQARWTRDKGKEGEELELTAGVKDIEDGNMVSFQVWKEGQDPDSHIAQAVLPATIEGGVARAVWRWRLIDAETVPEQDIKFFFTAHSAWCRYEKSNGAVIELKRPELSGPEWQDGEGGGTGKALVGEVLKLTVSCNVDMEEGAGVVFRVYEKGGEDEAAAELNSVNRGGKAWAEWAYEYRHDPENPPTKKPEFYFTASSRRCREVKSGEVEIGMNLYIQLITTDRIVIPKAKAKLVSGSEEKEILISGGFFEEKECIPGRWTFQLLEFPDIGNGNDRFEFTEDRNNVVLLPINVLMEDGFKLPQSDKKLAIIIDGTRRFSR